MNEPVELPHARWAVCLADPPWSHAVWTNRPSRTADSHYAVMPLPEIRALPVKSITYDSAVLFLWVPSPMLREGLDVMHAWDFEYKTVAFVWVKTTKDGQSTRIGLGHYTRPEAELCLLGTRGRIGTATDRAVRQVIFESMGAHSQKPQQQYERIERLYPLGRYLELFARRPDPRPGWTYWGFEANEHE